MPSIPMWLCATLGWRRLCRRTPEHISKARVMRPTVRVWSWNKHWIHHRWKGNKKLTKKWDKRVVDPESMWSDHAARNGFAYVSYIGSVPLAWKNRWWCQWERRKERRMWCAACLGQSFKVMAGISSMCFTVFSGDGGFHHDHTFGRCFRDVSAYIPAQSLRHYQSFPSNQGLVWMWRAQPSAQHDIQWGKECCVYLVWWFDEVSQTDRWTLRVVARVLHGW